MLSSQPPNDSADIFSLSDQVLADRLRFIQEVRPWHSPFSDSTLISHCQIGFGNWGSVWLCRPKSSRSTESLDDGVKVAVKLVHRSKTSTNAARVRSLYE